jgi:putative addiction module component (TIGR02574 family)
MSMAMTSIVAEAEQLSSADRIRLVEHVLATLDKPNPGIDQAWAGESERRLDAFCVERSRPPMQKRLLAQYLKP